MITKILKRTHGVSGVLTSVLSSPPPPVVETKKTKKMKSAAAPKEGASKATMPQPPRDASPGAKLAFKLAHAMVLPDEKERNALCYKLGRLANEIGPGDPDVAAAHEKARKDQKSFRVEGQDRSAAEKSDDVFYSWSAAFIAGYCAKTPAKGTPSVKRYLLTVTIEGSQPHEGRLLDATATESYSGKFDDFGAAHRAACRWYTVKSDVAHRMSVVIDTLDLEAPVMPGEPPAVIESLRTVVTLAEARTAASAADRRQNRGPITFSPKIGGRTLGFGVKVKESRCEFSRG